jgi:hypothetical protein
MRNMVALTVCCAVAGCADYGLQQRQAELNRLVGHGETEVVQRFGVPTRTYETGGLKFLAYSQSRIVYDPGIVSPFFGYGYFGPYAGGFPPTVYQRDCETTFQLRAGLVQAVTLRGNACG